MTRRLAILAALLAACGSALASGPMALLSIMDAPASGNPYAAYNPVAVWYPSRTLDYTDMVSGLAATNASRTGVVVGAKGFTFDGLSGSYLDFGRTIDFGTNRYIALSAWVNPTSTASMGIMGRTFFGGSHTNGRFALSRRFVTDVETFVQAAGTIQQVIATGTATNGTWTHVAVTLDRVYEGSMRLWQNGTNANTILGSSAVTNPIYPISSLNPFIIGAFGAPDAYRFAGSIDLSAVWISNTEINWSNMIPAIYSLGRTP